MPSIGEAVEQAQSVRRAGPDEVSAMARVLARAFHDDPAFTWVLRGDPHRMGILERGFELFLTRIWMEQEETYTTSGIVVVAAWELPDRWKLGILEQLRLLPAMLRTFSRHTARIVRALIVLEGKHPREPHYYLAFFGAEPEWQGRGVGSAALGPILARCDEESMPAYLEASTPRNRALYERHGFAVTEEFTLGRGAPLQWRMWREPAGAADQLAGA